MRRAAPAPRPRSRPAGIGTATDSTAGARLAQRPRERRFAHRASKISVGRRQHSTCAVGGVAADRCRARPAAAGARASRSAGSRTVSSGSSASDRAAAGDDRARRAPAAAARRRARLLARDPLAGAVGQRRAAVETRAELQRDPGPCRASCAQTKPRFSSRGLRLRAGPTRSGDSACGQSREAAAVHARVRIPHRDDDPRDARLDQRIDAGRRAAVVRTGLERDVGRARRAPRLAASRSANDLGVRLARALRASPRRPPGRHRTQHAADRRIRRRRIQSRRGELQRPRHVTWSVVRWRTRLGHFLPLVPSGLDAPATTARAAGPRPSAAAGAAAGRSPRGTRRRPGSCDRRRRSARRPPRRAGAVRPSRVRRRAAPAPRARRACAACGRRGSRRRPRPRSTRGASRAPSACRSAASTSSNGSRVASLFTTRGITSSADSKVVKRSPHCRHSRRRRTCCPSAERRESMTLVSS